jgi:hypothetical protein
LEDGHLDAQGQRRPSCQLGARRQWGCSG